LKFLPRKQLISEMFKFFLKENKECDGICRNISFLKMEVSKLIDYSTNMCWSDHGTIIIEV
jgi:hypothetical protein